MSVGQRMSFNYEVEKVAVRANQIVSASHPVLPVAKDSELASDNYQPKASITFG